MWSLGRKKSYGRWGDEGTDRTRTGRGLPVDQQPRCYGSFLLGNLSLPTNHCCPKPLSALRSTVRAAAQTWLASGGTGSRARGGDGALGVKAIRLCLACEAKQQPCFSSLLLTRLLQGSLGFRALAGGALGFSGSVLLKTNLPHRPRSLTSPVAQPLPSFHTHTCPGSGGQGLGQ